MEDAVISTEVKGVLTADPLIKGEQINVDTVQGVVQLSGRVDNQAQIERALELAQKVKGVESVKSSLAVQ
jgi:hyperosmotically inducible protein